MGWLLLPKTNHGQKPEANTSLLIALISNPTSVSQEEGEIL